MTAVARPAPWNDFRAVNASQFTEKGNLKSSFSQGSMEWDLSTGWHFRRQEGWKSKKNNGTMHTMHSHTITSGIDGKQYKLYSYDGYDDYIGFHAGTNQNYQERIAYALDAFDTSKHSPEDIKDVEGCGHIKRLKYSVREQVLLVNFVNGNATCVFFRVPTAVAGILFHDAESKQTIMRREIKARGVWYDRSGTRHVNKTSGKYAERHALGIHFWDYVRIRGCHTGARYPFEYVKHATGKVTNGSNRHTMRVKLKDIIGILGDDHPISKRLTAQLHNVWKDKKLDGEIELTTVFNEQELAELNKQLSELASLKRSGAERHLEIKEKEDNQQAEYAQWQDPTFESVLQNISKAESSSNQAANMMSDASVYGSSGTNERSEALYDLYETARSNLNEIFREFQSSPSTQVLLKDYYNKYMARGYQKQDEDGNWEITQEGKRLAMNDFMRTEAGVDLKNAYDFKRGEAKSNLNYETVKSLVRALNGNGFITSWVQKNIPAKYKMQYLGRGWTPKELEEFANHTVPGNIGAGDVSAYRKFVQAKDWQGALSFLKTHKTNLVYHNPINGAEKILRRQPYASQYDFLATEE